MVVSFFKSFRRLLVMPVVLAAFGCGDTPSTAPATRPSNFPTSGPVGSTKPTTSASATTAATGVSKDQARRLAEQYAHDAHLGWDAVTNVVPEGRQGYTVIFETPPVEERTIGPRSLRVSPSGEVRRGARK